MYHFTYTRSCAALRAADLDWIAELQKRTDRADQSVLFFLAGANFWEKHAKNCAILRKTVLFFGAIFLGGKIGRC